MSKLLRNGVPRTEDGKIDFSWKNHYGFTGLIVLLGFLFPPLAVAIRFGIGKDFFINVLLTICGIIPGHIHNWFIQNVRNNDTKARTPKWAIRYGLVDDRPAKKLMKKRAWTGRFNDRLPPSQRVVYDDDGNAHVVEEEVDVEVREDRERITAPWNVHAPGEVREHKTGLLEPDQWINQDPPTTQSNTNYYSHGHSTSHSKKSSKLNPFKRSSATPTTPLENHIWSQDESKKHLKRIKSTSTISTISSTNNDGVVTPEDPYRSFSPYTSTEARKNQHQHQHTQNVNLSRTTREDDIFSHEF
ncbi:uncharacterized protein UTRI_03949 [Ustilago trichophora]|uniref:Uncharacterized protein n=1 Tax=Ustilago trichophora TaxID=86804 RepID=A0A5C3E8B0_9BASI|nr:uncharacterized protein UTRI_03949 [Ustilago trichophora]